MVRMIRALAFAATVIATPALAQERSGAASFGIEAAGGAIGSAAGVSLGLLVTNPAECDEEDLACILQDVGLTGLFAAVAAPIGSVALGNAYDTSPSMLGAAVGSVAGVAAGAGVIKLFDEAGVSLGGFGVGVVFTLTHGIVTALGSRVGASIR